MTLATKAPRFKSKFITSELARLFSQSDSEEDFEGFSDEEENERCSNKGLKIKAVDSEHDSDMDTGFYSDGEVEPSTKRRSLLVAIRFPMKTPKQEARKRNAKKPVKENPRPKRACRGRTMKQTQQEEEEEEEEEKKEEEEGEEKKEEEEGEEGEKEDGEEVLYQSLKKRDKNIQENKAMLAKLFADLDTMADLTLHSTPPKKRRTSEKATPRKRKLEAGAVSERRNPSRKARPPENFAVEEKSEVTRKASGPRTVDLKRLVMIDEEIVDHNKKTWKRKSSVRRGTQVVKSVDDITEEDLDNIAYRSKDKIWDKENGSSCHQCRQKTLDTKTVCRSGFCFGSKGQFCGPCLKNRYGEDVRTVLLDPNWSCPLCRGVCNCSLCRKREGRCATGILVGLARFNGHDNVHEYLESIQKELR